ncbi:HSP chaperone complex subunit [Schizosaccharomyces japonicus yFS275]|uniref:HSP chaperone complex subunit n=1 Tax=Schizosaccharomyces japonicus (strain yFS275 / FY16936) TaxID=402676 RepID=B6JZ88_SCHJY|nr:HSP chaperone complex subunit [Schizosaccharomyces japonicus yFS275]EEB06856.1 HSP chaperone complex subunit [Schizosaccharomyces japonicus yFS275]
MSEPSEATPVAQATDVPTRDKTSEQMFDELNKIPFFMQSLDEAGDEAEENLELEALKAMAYEGEPHEIAQNFREHGNECFKQKQYKEAIEYYTKAIAQKCGHTDIEIACYSNRAGCNLIFGNYRKVLDDCAQVLKRDPKHVKAYYRSAKALIVLKRLDEAEKCLDVCKSGNADDPAIVLLEKELITKKKQQEKLLAEKARREQSEALRRDALTNALKQRSIRVVASEESPDMGDAKLHLEVPEDASSELFFPTILLYPLESQSDFVPALSEHSTAQDLLNTVFETPAEWDTSAEYRPNVVDAFIQTSTGGLVKVGKRVPILKVLQHPKVVVMDGIIQLIVVPKNKTAEWLATRKTQA